MITASHTAGIVQKVDLHKGIISIKEVCKPYTIYSDPYIGELLQKVADFYNLKVEAFFNQGRQQTLVRAKHLFLVYAHLHTSYTQTELCNYLNYASHVMVIYAHNRLQNIYDPLFKDYQNFKKFNNYKKNNTNGK